MSFELPDKPRDEDYDYGGEMKSILWTSVTTEYLQELYAEIERLKAELKEAKK